MVQGMDHQGHLIIDRDELEEDVVYRYNGVRRAIPYLREGDEIRIQRAGKSYDQLYLTVVNGRTQPVEVEKDTGKQYDLWSSWEAGLERSPWLRYNGDSAGEVTSLTVKNLNR